MGQPCRLQQPLVRCLLQCTRTQRACLRPTGETGHAAAWLAAPGLTRRVHPGRWLTSSRALDTRTEVRSESFTSIARASLHAQHE